MKKLILSLLLVSTSVFAWEVNVKVGYDFLRFRQDNTKNVKETKKDGMGFILGGEIVPVDLGIVSFGAGFEYNFGIKNIRFDGKEPSSKMFVPFYTLLRLNAYRTENKDGTVSVSYTQIRAHETLANLV
ncbi:hypothetical protein, partial [Oceanivirga salmonicida]|uniref:hypothetical protein n=1 Tax=Oceanivirga salmonicida TaxID=1769291 RepID=UPI0012E3CD8A